MAGARVKLWTARNRHQLMRELVSKIQLVLFKGTVFFSEEGVSGDQVIETGIAIVLLDYEIEW